MEASQFAKPKPAFSARTFHAAINQLAQEFPEMNTTTWQEVVAHMFDLTAEQQERIANFSAEESNELQNNFQEIAQHVRDGGAIHGKIIKNADGTHKAWVVMQPSIESASVTPQMKALVGCDADCRNWCVWC